MPLRAVAELDQGKLYPRRKSFNTFAAPQKQYSAVCRDGTPVSAPHAPLLRYRSGTIQSSKAPLRLPASKL